MSSGCFCAHQNVVIEANLPLYFTEGGKCPLLLARVCGSPCSRAGSYPVRRFQLRIWNSFPQHITSARHFPSSALD